MEYENNELISFFNKAKAFVIENGYEDEINSVNNLNFNEIAPCISEASQV